MIIFILLICNPSDQKDIGVHCIFQWENQIKIFNPKSYSLFCK